MEIRFSTGLRPVALFQQSGAPGGVLNVEGGSENKTCAAASGGKEVVTIGGHMFPHHAIFVYCYSSTINSYTPYCNSISSSSIDMPMLSVTDRPCLQLAGSGASIGPGREAQWT